MNNTYILLHGAWHTNWCWQYVVPLLETTGARVLAPNLPGHGDSPLPIAEVSLKTYVDFVVDLIKQQQGLVTLVGHSMAGIILSQVANIIPERIKQLVYVTAFVVDNDHALIDAAKNFSAEGVSAHFIVDIANNSIALKKSNAIKKLFYNCCSADDAQKAYSLLQAEPYQPFHDVLNLSVANYGRVKKCYIECLQDVSILPFDQRQMYAGRIANISTIDADHSPMLSSPEQLTQAILNSM